MWLLLIVVLPLLRANLVISTTFANETMYFGMSSGCKQGCKHQQNLAKLLSSLSIKASNSNTHFYNSSSTQNLNKLYGQYLCRGDINQQICSDCVKYAKNEILKIRCFGYEGLYWFDHCMVRYSNKPFSGKLEEIPWSASYDNKNLTTKTSNILFAQRLEGTMNGLVSKANFDEGTTISKNFATRLVRINRLEYLYAMGQCTWDLTASDCSKCLSMAIDYLRTLTSASSKAKVFYPNCMVRYETLSAFQTHKLLQSRSSSTMSY